MPRRKESFLITLTEEERAEKGGYYDLFIPILSFLCLFGLLVGITYGVRSVLSFTISRLILMEICFFSSAWVVFLFSFKKIRKLGVFLTILGVVLYFFYYREKVIKGFCIILNYLVEKVNFYYRTQFGYYAVKLNEEKEVLPSWSILILLTALVIGYFFIVKKRSNIIISSAAFIIIAGILVGRLVQPGTLFLLIGVSFCSRCLAGKDSIKNAQAFRIASIGMGIIVTLLILFVFVGTVFLKPNISPVLNNWHEIVREWDSTMERKIENSVLYMRINDALYRIFYKKEPGQLTNSEPKHTGKKVLSITAKGKVVTQNLYLKGWVGGEYSQNEWGEIPEEKFGELAEKFNKNVKDSGLIIQNLLYYHLKEFPLIDPTIDECRIYVKEFEDSSYKYVPYGMMLEDDLVPYGDAYIKEDNTNGNTYTGYSIYPDFLAYKVRRNVEHGKSEELEIFWNQIKVGETKVFDPFAQDFSVLFSGEDNLYIPEEREMEKSIKEIEKKYNLYGKSEYTKVPEGLDQLKQLCEEEKRDNIWDAKEFILNYLSSRMTYSTQIDALPYGEDFAEYFLFQQKKGFCTHFATTATLMFRMMGYPARYVSGYVVTPSMYEKMEDGYYSANVTDDMAHAWTEVYVEGKGFIPIETTPGYTVQETNEKKQEDNLEDTSDNLLEEENEKKSDMLEKKEEKNSQNKSNKSVNQKNTAAKEEQKEIWDFTFDVILMKLFKKFMGICLIIIALGAAIMARRQIRIKNRKLRLLQPDYRKAVEQISHELHRILFYSGYKKDEHVSDQEYGEYIERTLDYWNKNEYSKFLEIARSGLFSEKEISEADRNYCYLVYNKVLQNESLKKEGLMRFYWKYILCY